MAGIADRPTSKSDCGVLSSAHPEVQLYDDAQSICRTSRGLDFSLSSVGIKAAGRTSILRLNDRNTREILQFACDFGSKFMDVKAADVDHIPMVQPESGGISGPGPAFRQFASIGDEITYATRCLKAWHERGDLLGDIAVIGEMVDRRWWILDHGVHPNGVKYDSPGQRPGFQTRK